MSECLVNLETGEIKWDDIKKLYYEHVEDNAEKFECKKCQSVFYSKTYFGKYPLCKKHRNNNPLKNNNINTL